MGKHSKILDSWKHETIVHGIHVPVYGVKKSSKYGVFYGTVIPCPQDYDNINDWDGYKFAERKCDIQIIHARAKMLKERAQGIKNLINVLTTKYEKTDDEGGLNYLKDIWYQYNIAYKEYEKAYNQYVYMRDSFSEYTNRVIKRRKKLNEKIEKQRKENE